MFLLGTVSNAYSTPVKHWEKHAWASLCAEWGDNYGNELAMDVVGRAYPS